jgi:tRNA-specific 2-thiouridylase
MLTQKQLSKTLFPIGHLLKPAVRKLAEKFGLITAIKKDSQGLCFIGKIDMKEFLKLYIKEKKGKVLDEKGKVIGEHDGAYYLTIGQRHGFTITKKTPGDAPYYVIAKDAIKNTITVSQKPPTSDAASNVVEIKKVNWALGKKPDFSKTYSARLRYRAPLEKCILKENGSSLELHFENPQKAVTEGQSAVIYDGEICLGGGIIEA